MYRKREPRKRREPIDYKWELKKIQNEIIAFDQEWEILMKKWETEKVDQLLAHSMILKWMNLTRDLGKMEKSIKGKGL